MGEGNGRLPTGELEKALARKIVRTGTVLQRVAGLTALRDRAIDAIVKRIVEVSVDEMDGRRDEVRVTIA